MMSILLSVEFITKIHGLYIAFWPTLIFDKNVTEILRTSLESSFYVDHNGTILSFKFVFH